MGQSSSYGSQSSFEDLKHKVRVIWDSIKRKERPRLTNSMSKEKSLLSKQNSMQSNSK